MQGEEVLACSGSVIAPSASPCLTWPLCLVALFVVFQALDGLGLEATPLEVAGEILFPLLRVKFLSIHSHIAVLILIYFDFGL